MCAWLFRQFVNAVLISLKDPEIFSEGSNEDVWTLNLYQVNGLQVFHLIASFSQQAKVKYHQYPAWGYVIYAIFALVPMFCIVYPPLKDYFVHNNSDDETAGLTSESYSTVLCCCLDWSRNYNVSPRNSKRVNGHVNHTVEGDDG